ncbi:hypothetical protein, partial [Algiphilus sp.]|uniref:hypothetical protein n=1 Tax=Algiphilus sp. TaxID=1872431 RepID=UPI0025BD4DB2
QPKPKPVATGVTHYLLHVVGHDPRGVEQRRIDKKLKVVLILRGMAMNQEHETTEKEAIGYLRATEAVLKLVGLTEAVERADAGAQQIVEGDI